MARPLQDIIDQIDNDLSTNIPSLNSPSQTAIWRLYRYCIALAIYAHEQLWDLFRNEIETIAAQSISGTPKWYADQVKKFQFGYSLSFNNNTYRFFYADNTSFAAISAQIIKKSAVREVYQQGFNGIAIKVAKDSGAGVLGPLSSSEETSLMSFVNQIKFAGVQTQIINLPADDLKINLIVYYDGVLDLLSFSGDVETAIKNHLNAIEFDGIFYINKLIDAIQVVPGYQEMEVINIQAKAASASIFTVINHSYDPVSGYFSLIPVGANAATDSIIQYIPI